LTELIVGTKKGLFLLEGEPSSGFEIQTRAFAGQPVDFATRDPRSGRLLATVTSPFYGPKIFYTDGEPGDDWARRAAAGLARRRWPRKIRQTLRTHREGTEPRRARHLARAGDVR
jgi:hypothetical protein